MKTNIVSYACSAITLATSAVSLSIDEIKSIILLILGVVSALLAISLSIYKWYKEASKDGKITTEELKKGAEIIAQGIEKVEEIATKEEHKDGDKN